MPKIKEPKCLSSNELQDFKDFIYENKNLLSNKDKEDLFNVYKDNEVKVQETVADAWYKTINERKDKHNTLNNGKLENGKCSCEFCRMIL